MNEEKEIILENEKYFNFYKAMPTVLAWAYAIAVFILGLVLAIEVSGVYLCILIALILTPVIYLFVKGIMSYYILNIYYLKVINKNLVYIGKSKNTGEQIAEK